MLEEVFSFIEFLLRSA